jgi:predicted SAM-dependent methyltransferase
MPIIRLYAGDIPDLREYDGLIGLSLTRNDSRLLQHDLKKPFPLPDNSVDSFQAEDVFEHIGYDELVLIINEVFRILKHGGLFRLSLPDYGCDLLRERSVKDARNNIIFDPEGGGTPENPGHVWFPRIITVKALLGRSLFADYGDIRYLHYYAMDGSYETHRIDYTQGHVQRTPDFDRRVQKPYRPMSMVIDLIKIDG